MREMSPLIFEWRDRFLEDGGAALKDNWRHKDNARAEDKDFTGKAWCRLPR